MPRPVAAEAQRNTPALGQDSQHVLECVGRRDRAPGKADQLVAIPQPAPIRVGLLQNVGDHDAAVVVEACAGAERGVVDDAAAFEATHEVLDLVDRNGIARAHVHSPPLLERRAADDADQAALGVEQRPARVARIDRRVGLQAVGVFQQGAGRALVAVRSRDDAVGYGGLEVGGQEEGVARHKAPVAQTHLVAVAQGGVGEVVAAEELQQGDVAGRIQAHDHGVVDLAVGHAALHGVAARPDDVEVGQGVAVRRDDHSRAAPLPAGREDRQHRPLGLGDHGDASVLGLEHRRVHFEGRGRPDEFRPRPQPTQ